ASTGLVAQAIPLAASEPDRARCAEKRSPCPQWGRVPPAARRPGSRSLAAQSVLLLWFERHDGDHRTCVRGDLPIVSLDLSLGVHQAAAPVDDPRLYLHV